MTNFETCRLAWEHVRQGRHQEARELFEQVLSRDARYADALHGAGYVAWAQGRQKSAMDFLSRAIRVDAKRDASKRAQAYVHLAACQHDLGQLDAAIESVRCAMRIDGKEMNHHAALGTLLKEKGDLPAAIAAFEQALQIAPNNPAALINLSDALLREQRIGDAEAAARRAAEAAPNLPMALRALASALQQQMRAQEAVELLTRAVQLAPSDAGSRFELGTALLRCAEFERGWREYEARLAMPDFSSRFVKLDTPRWDGSPLRGRTLLVQAEQGLGDVIQFSRFVPQITGGRVLLRCDQSLMDLMRTLGGAVEVVDPAEPTPPHDVHVHMMSLAHVLEGSADSEAAIARGAATPYLHADPQRVRDWESKLPPRDERSRLRVGLAWAGNPMYAQNRARSVEAKLLAPLAEVAGVSFVSLQKERHGAAPAVPMFDPTPDLRDFADTAALLTHLDLIVSIDSAVAHLAAALGRPTWTMLPYVAEWRWLLDRSDSPWYPTMRLFRQTQRGDWTGVIAQVARELNELARRST